MAPLTAEQSGRAGQKMRPVTHATPFGGDIQRGSLTVWVSEEAIRAWHPAGPKKHGGQVIYSDLAIESCLRLRMIYSLALRKTQGFVKSLFRLLDIALPVPDYSTISRRQGPRAVGSSARKRRREAAAEEVHVVIDSTGLSVYGRAEWAQKKHLVNRGRRWRTLRAAVDPKTGEITAARVGGNEERDRSQARLPPSEKLCNRGFCAGVGTTRA